LSVDVKICGVNTPESLRVAADERARSVGFVFHPRSPRAVTPGIAADLSRLLPTTTGAVGLFVDAPDDFVAEVVKRTPLNLLQLHGEETPRRVAEIRARFGIPVMKAIRIATAADLAVLGAYESAADWILFDAKPPPGVTALPGGAGIAFDWRLLRGVRPAKPWMLAGGLTAANLADAVAASGARAVDVSSGVEERPGVKSAERIREFMAAARLL
jgi:phosphoribosylanthranilate isomerase